MDNARWENIRCLRNQLCSEIDPTSRSHLQELLVEKLNELTTLLAEEDNMQAACLNLLAEAERVITHGAVLIQNQKALVAVLDNNGHDSTRARALLDALTQNHVLHQHYHQKLLIAFKQAAL